MTDTFTWKVTSEASGDGEFTLTESKFGDGYSQDVAIGLNNEVQKWNVTFVGSKAQAQEVMDFIRAHKGQMFFWTPPLGTQSYFKCKKYGINDQGKKTFSITMTFEQAFAP